MILKHISDTLRLLLGCFLCYWVSSSVTFGHFILLSVQVRGVGGVLAWIHSINREKVKYILRFLCAASVWIILWSNSSKIPQSLKEGEKKQERKLHYHSKAHAGAIWLWVGQQRDLTVLIRSKPFTIAADTLTCHRGMNTGVITSARNLWMTTPELISGTSCHINIDFPCIHLQETVRKGPSDQLLGLMNSR